MEEQLNGQNNLPTPQPNPETQNNETVVQLQHDQPRPTVIQPAMQPSEEIHQLPAELQPEVPVEQQRPAEVPQPEPEIKKSDYQYQSGNLQPSGQIGQNEAQDSQPESQTRDSVSWSASEFVHHEKNGGWHLMIALGTVVLAVAVYFLTKSIFGASTIIIIGVIFSIFGKLKPRVLDYAVTPEGLLIGEKHFDYLTFRSFAVVEEGQTPSLQLLPQKRFAVPLTIYFAPADQDKIVNVLGEYLPFEHREQDFVDKLSAKLHF